MGLKWGFKVGKVGSNSFQGEVKSPSGWDQNLFKVGTKTLSRWALNPLRCDQIPHPGFSGNSAQKVQGLCPNPKSVVWGPQKRPMGSQPGAKSMAFHQKIAGILPKSPSNPRFEDPRKFWGMLREILGGDFRFPSR